MGKPAKPPEPTPDRTLNAIGNQAAADRTAALQDQVNKENQDLLRRFGVRTALSGAQIGSPMTIGT